VIESGNVLSIRGNRGRHVIQITDNGGRDPGSLTVTCDGVTTLSAGTITELRVNTGGGRDSVVYNLTGALASRLSRNLDISLGDGNDSFVANLAGNIPAGATLNMNVDGGPGNDKILVNAPSVNIAPGGTLRLFLVGGDGSDRVTTNYEGVVDGRLLMREEGNPQPDHVSANVTLDSGSTGLAGVEGRGGSNIDVVSVIVRKQNPADPVTIDGIIDGGQSIDFCTYTRNVVASTCEINQVV
jgi:hypothetical protein